MKTIIALGIAVALLGATGSSIFAQTQTTSSSTTTYMETSKLIGTTVKGPKGESIGQIKDVILDANGCMAYTVVSTGGTGSRVTGTSKTVAVPWAVYSRTSDPKVVTVRVEKEKIYSAPVFDYARINEYSTGGYINNVYSYYGVSAGTAVGVSAGVNSTNTTTTSNTGVNTTTANTGVNATTTNAGVNTTTNAPGATASPYPSVTPAATASATMTPMGTATPNATATSSPAPSASATSSPMSHKTHAGSTPSAKRHTSDAESNGDGSSSAHSKHSSEGSGSSDEGASKSSHKKHRGSGEESKSEPESTPSGD